MPTVRTIGISGPSCSGKTTVTRILQRLLRNSLVIYQDDFFKPDDKIPIDPNTQLANWDCPDALDFPKLKATIAFVRTNGILPPEFQSNEINNTHDGSGLLSDEAFQRLCTMVSTWDQKDSIFLIVDGFMLYWDESIYQDLECRVFITASYDVLKSRREARQGYTTKEGYWQDPPGYFDAIVWPEYVKWNKHLLDKDENIHDAVENVLVLDTTKESIEKSATRTFVGSCNWQISGPNSLKSAGIQRNTFLSRSLLQAFVEFQVKLERTTSREESLQNDPRFRKYNQLIEKNLNSFDAVNEWADIISFLGRLLKSFQAYPQFPVIPRKYTVSKRLAQCLNPGFPAGVHQKTLDVYAYILETIGPEQLAEDLALWSMGLFPFVQHAAMHVKPQLLSIFEKFYLPLKNRLRPAMRGFVIALLPALDEEGSEFFDKVVDLMDQLGETVDLPFFYSCIWRIMISNPGLRPPALNYLLRRLPKMAGKEDVAVVFGTSESISLMVRAFAATLLDQQLLVQRGMLELLVQNFMLKHRTIPHDDLVVLMRSALAIVLRKDMSLNRRLYAWLLGDDSSSQKQVIYFNTYAEKAATQAIRGLFFASTDIGQQQQHNQDRDAIIADAQKPYKILISLLDKWEIGQTIVQNVFTDSLQSIQTLVRRGSYGAEILQTANMWMEMVEPYMIWTKLFSMIDKSLPSKSNDANSATKRSSPEEDLDNLHLVQFTLQSFKFTDQEIRQMHLPLVLAALSKKLEESLRYSAFIHVLPQIDCCIQLMHTIYKMIPENMFGDRPTTKTENGTTEVPKQFQSGMDILEYARDYYGIRSTQVRVGSNNGTNEQNGADAKLHPNGEDDGDLSISHKDVNVGKTLNTVARPIFGPVRGPLLVKEVANYLAEFLVGLVSSYIIPTNDMNTGVDVGVEGKRLQKIDSQLEKVFHGACSALMLISKHANESFQWNGNNERLLSNTLLACCQHGPDFGIVDTGLSTLALLTKRPFFLGDAVLKNRKNLKCVMDRLWSFLSPNLPLLHMRTVQLVWLLTESSLPLQIETIVSAYLVASDDEQRSANYEKFGIVWEHSEDVVEAATIFARPLFLVLDTLREGSSPLDRRLGETWLRYHLKNYARILEPFVISMLSKNIMRRATEKRISFEHQTTTGQETEVVIPFYIYLRPFDMATVDYMFANLVSLSEYGTTAFLKACKNHRIGNIGAMPHHIETSLGISAQDSQSLSFLEVLVHISLRFLASEPNDKYRQTMEKSIRSIQLRAAELLYQVVSKLDHVDMHITRLVQENVLRKLLFCVNTGNLELQQKLLHVVHATMAITAAAALHHHKGSPEKYRRHGSIDSATNDALNQYSMDSVSRIPLAGVGASQAAEAVELARDTTALFVKCVSDALTLPSNRPILQHWIDFILASLSNLRGGFRQMVVPILMTICEQVTLCHTAVRLLMHGESSMPSLSTMSAYHSRRVSEEIAPHMEKDHRGPYLQEHSAVVGGPEQDILVFLNGLERIASFCLTERGLTDEWYPNKSPDCLLLTPKIDNSSTLYGFAQLVHSAESVRPGDVKPRDAILYQLPVILHILLDVWRVFSQPDWDPKTVDAVGHAKRDAILQSFAFAADHVKARLESIFERFYKFCTFDFMEGFTEIFFMENPLALEYETSSEQYDLSVLHVLSATPTSSPQHILSTLLDGIRQRTPGMPVHRRRNILRTGKLTDTSILRFAEIYCKNLIKMDPLAQLWPLIHSFAKDYLSQASAHKMFLPGLLRFLTVAVDGLIQSSVIDDRKTRRDAQDLYQRCVDYCILIAGRSFDQGIWLRRSNAHEEDDASYSPSDSLSLSETTLSDVTRNMSTSNVSDLEKKAGWKSSEDVLIAQVNTYLATVVIPELRQIIGDQDRIVSLLNNLVYYVIGPALRSKAVFGKTAIVLDQICEMTKMPFSYKTWRKEVWDVFLDNRFFYMDSATAKRWRTIIETVFNLEKERFTELMGRITTSPSTAFFSNKDQETINRAFNLRRLSYVIFCGVVDQYVPQLPVIQEKIVELLKLEHGEMVHVEIYLCLRIMLVRFSQKHLLNFWPVLVTELMRLFNTYLSDGGHDRPEEAQIALAGCKFLDLLCTLETDAFQIYQWIFIRDTVDSITRRKAREGPKPVMDMLSEKLTHDDSFSEPFSRDVPDSPASVPSMGQLKRPMLTMSSISSIRQLSFFIDHVGLYVYQSSFTLAQPDIPFIESLLQNDLLEGDIENK